jgi:hypothetical protein
MSAVTIESPRAVRKLRKASPQSEHIHLIRQAAKAAHALASSTIDSNLHDYARDHADRAVCILGRLAYPNTWEPVAGMDETDPSMMLNIAAEELEMELRCIQERAGENLIAAAHDTVLLQHCQDYLHNVIDSIDSLPGERYVADLTRLAITLRGVVPSAAARAPQVKPVAAAGCTLNGYTPDQMSDVLGQMACNCDAAAEMMLDIGAHIGGTEWSPGQMITYLHLTAQTVRMVGAMADQATGSIKTVGGPIAWSMGEATMKEAGNA